MSYAIVGFGAIGQALARAFARKGVEVSVATRRDPKNHAETAAEIGAQVVPKTLAEALKADVVFLAVRFDAHKDVAKALSDWRGKTVVDVINAYGVPPESLDGATSSEAIARAFGGAHVVKGFNHLVAAKLNQDPTVQGGRRVVFLAGDDEDATNTIGELAHTLGFAPVQLGRLADGGLLVQARGDTWGRLIFEDLIKFDG